MPMSAGEIAGIYGAVVATGSLAWQEYRRRHDERTDVRVEAAFDAVPEAAMTEAEELFMADYRGVRGPGFFISVFNAGVRTEHLEMIGMGPHADVADPTSLYWFPGGAVELPPRGAVTRSLPLNRLAREEGQWAFCARLSSGRLVWSKVVRLPTTSDTPA